VLNGTGQAAEETSARIREVAARLRYAPNEAARALIRSRTHMLGVLLPDLHGEFFSEVIRGIDQRARQAGFHLLVSSFHADPREMETALRAMRGRVDGLILMSPDVDTRELLRDIAADLRTVLLNAPSADGLAGDSVSVDNVGGARAMVKHLLGLGHRRIAMIKGAERNYDARERLRGYRLALRGARAEVSSELEVAGDFTESAGFAAAESLLRLKHRPRAIFAANDAMAVGAMSALRDAGVRVPEDIALAGFDDVPMARYLTPPLSSVHVAIDELGRRATDLALRSAKGTAPLRPRREMLRTTLVVRSSCGAGLGRRGMSARGGDSDTSTSTGNPKSSRGTTSRRRSSQEART
jgi:LacI family transcriptional regulator